MPLGMETVMELDERRFSNMPNKDPPKKFQSQAVFCKKKKGQLVKQTTEENIAMQQKLDFASAEDLISYRSKPDIIEERIDSTIEVTE